MLIKKYLSKKENSDAVFYTSCGSNINYYFYFFRNIGYDFVQVLYWTELKEGKLTENGSFQDIH